jgi:hypothetical protein
VTHRTFGSLAQCYDAKIHTYFDARGNLAERTVLLVKVVERGAKSHHKDGDNVIWSPEDCR